MFAFVEGLLDYVSSDSCVVDVGGMGFLVGISSQTLAGLPEVGKPVKLYTYTAVREDAIALYGFLNRDDLEVFKLLITVSGVGPKVALGILSSMDADSLRFAIMSGDVKALSAAQGVGKRTAERIILELKDKISNLDVDVFTGCVKASVATTGAGALTEAEGEAISALTSLGHPATDSRKAVLSIEGRESMDSGSLLSAALKKLF